MAIDRTAAKAAKPHDSGQFSTFYIADLFFGVDVLHVQEVLRFQPMTPVPQAPDVIEGLINLRGQIVTAIDMRRRLQMPRLAADHPPMNIVVKTPDGAVSLLVDEIGDVLDMDAANYERPPDNLDPTAKELISGVYKMKDSLLLVLDTEKAIDACGSAASYNAKLDSQTPDGATNGKPLSSPDSNDIVDEPTRSQVPAGKTAKKMSAKKTDSGARAGKPVSM
jgi:purine-binding chemotaxis protein CheW